MKRHGIIVSPSGELVIALMGSPMSTSEGNSALESVVKDLTPDSDKNNKSPYSD